MTGAGAVSLRTALVRHLTSIGTIRDRRIAAAFQAVPRHVFVPHVPLEIAYADDVVPMKQDRTGVLTSSVSQPSIIALMLQQAAIRPGDRVLEIGSGGYNAALLRELAGPDGAVTTVDIDADVTRRARASLDKAGYGDVAVVRADGEFGDPGRAPYDRIVVTVTAWEVAPAWLRQLRPDGRIVVPLRVRGQTRSVAFDRVGEHLESRSTTMCGFVSMQGAGAHYERYQDGLTYDEDQEDEPHPEGDVLELRCEQEWSGLQVHREEPLLDLYLWLAATLPGYCALDGEGVAAVATADSLAYVSRRRGRDESHVELGCTGHGPEARVLIDRVLEQMRQWDGQHPTFQVHPIGAGLPPGFHIARRHSYISVQWEA
ncbi:protein-L-isoaspartate(D-aspartate) O-methyltransferase [Kribbella aluminosa]|uniref:Protein-L-isoaspartate O-methyltransferase n=1 Tax=Kribbella aluminosa TaxID=416017 RepID=A0ABS4UKR3_9ACTN|nr:methyltransferase, FxLD system [Kribbella aluminosa]MBP2352235.1 protein-L-isoaspartate(D-aspartate) O-methyltransferase [Kribbella aluminosa]